jgi:hypothetical protein
MGVEFFLVMCEATGGGVKKDFYQRSSIRLPVLR